MKQEKNMGTLNTPNKLVLLRFFLAIVVITLLLCVPYAPSLDFLCPTGKTQNILNLIAMGIFLLAAITDYLDGHLARKNNQITSFGKLFDPLADKILINSVMIIFTVFARIPIWVTILFLIRDFLVDGLRMFVTSKGEIIAANKWGKQKTIWQFIGLFVLFFSFPDPNINHLFDYTSLYNLALIPLYLGLFFSMFSGYVYYAKNWKFISKI